jgi:hypothetical protein
MQIYTYIFCLSARELASSISRKKARGNIFFVVYLPCIYFELLLLLIQKFTPSSVTAAFPCSCTVEEFWNFYSRIVSELRGRERDNSFFLFPICLVTIYHLLIPFSGTSHRITQSNLLALQNTAITGILKHYILGCATIDYYTCIIWVWFYSWNIKAVS